MLVDLDVKHIDPGEFLEQYALAFHYRLRGQRADVAQAEHSGAIGDDCDEVATSGIARNSGWVTRDFFARRSDTRRVGQRQITLVHQLLAGRYVDLAGLRELVIVQRRFAQCLIHFFSRSNCCQYFC